MKIILPERFRPYLEGQLPASVTPVYTRNVEEACEAASQGIEVAWFDLLPVSETAAAILAGTHLKWVTTMFAGLDGFPLEYMQERGILLTNGAGVHAIPCAEYVLLGMLAVAKNFPEVVRAQDRKEWLAHPPGHDELAGSRALIIGYGHIGRAIAERLRAFGVSCVGVRRSPSNEPDVISSDAWRDRLGEFDWIILAAPATRATHHLIGAAELARMKRTARVVNIARGSLIDGPALVAAVRRGTIAGAFLDVTDPEPLPPDDPLWSTPGIILSMHLSGRSQTGLGQRGAELFLDNLNRYLAGQPLRNQVDLARGY